MCIQRYRHIIHMDIFIYVHMLHQGRSKKLATYRHILTWSCFHISIWVCVRTFICPYGMSYYATLIPYARMSIWMHLHMSMSLYGHMHLRILKQSSPKGHLEYHTACPYGHTTIRTYVHIYKREYVLVPIWTYDT